MGCGNTNEKITKRMTDKKFEKVTIIEERYNLLKELEGITGVAVVRDPVPDWKLEDNKQSIDHNQLKTTDKIKCFNDIAGTQRKSTKTNHETPMTSRVKAKVSTIIEKGNQNINNKVIQIHPCLKWNEQERSGNTTDKHADHTTRSHYPEEGSPRPLVIRPKQSHSNTRVLDVIKKNILEGKKEQLSGAMRFRPQIHHSRISLIIGQPNESDYEYE